MHANKKYNEQTMTLERFGFVGTDRSCFWGMIGVHWVEPLKVDQLIPTHTKAPGPGSKLQI